MSEKPKNKACQRKRMQLEPLESRTLYSADPFSVGISAVDAAEDTSFTDSDSYLNFDPDQASTGLLSSDATSIAPDNQLEIIFIDEATPDHQLLVQDLLSNSSPDRTFEVITIGSDQDGIQLITDTLAQRSELSAVHLISHGSDGNVNIGNTVLNQSTLSTNENAISSWGNAFTEDGDLLIYGCNFSATDKGLSLGANIAALADIDIASSDNRTGGADVGGDWVLEQVVGSVETSVPFSAEFQDSYQRSLVSSIDVSTPDDIVDAPSTASFDDLNLNAGADGKISLREAILAANAQAGADTINLDAETYELNTVGFSNNDFGVTGDLDVTSDITINGVDSSSTSISATALGDRMIDVHSGGTLNLIDLTIANGAAPGISGGAIYNEGTLNTDNTVFENNKSNGNSGGAVANNGIAYFDNTLFTSNSANSGGAILTEPGSTTTVIRSTLENNAATISGGGAINNFGTLIIESSTFIDNSSRSHGGAIFNLNSGQIDITNSTFTGNSTGVSAAGGALFNLGGTTNIHYSTFVGNSATNTGGAIAEDIGTVTIGSSIFADNTVLTNWGAPEILDVSVSDGYNIIKDPARSGTFNPHPQDQLGVDPDLQPLASNGSTTKTFAPNALSPAIDNGGPTTLTEDQRGLTRDADPDVGAHEVTSVTVSNSPVISPSTGTANYTTNSLLIVDNSIGITDADSLDFNNGIFSVALSGFSEAQDEIGIQSTGLGSGEISLNNSFVGYENTIIGTWSGGTNGTPLTVNLNSTATLAAVNALAQSITFSHNGQNPQPIGRTLTYEVSDGDGENSTPVDINIDIVSVNNPPAGTDTTITTNEDTPLTIQSTDFGFSDAIDGDLFAAVTITTLPSNGTLTLATPTVTQVTAGQTISISDINAGGLVFTPLADGNGASFTELDFQVHDNGGTANGGTDQDQTQNTITIDVNAANDAPDGTDNTLVGNEDSAITLQAADFGFSDSVEGDFFAAVTVTTLPANGTLSLAGISVAPAQTISITRINAGNLVFTPLADGNGVGFTEFDFQVHDNGGTANGGIDQNQTPNTITFDVRNVNDAPSGTDNTLATNEDSAITLQSSDFGFSDLNDGDFIAAVTVTTLPANGTMSLAGVPVTAGQTISVTDINNGDLVFAPLADGNGSAYADFDFQVHDNGGITNGGIDQDQSANTITFDVNNVNDAPTGSDNTLSTNEDTSITLQGTDFGFSDSIDGDFFAAVTVTTLPANGTLTLTGNPVTSGQTISISKINKGDLVFAPLPDGNGAGFSDFDFQVHDSGGIANSGIDQDPSPNTITLDVNSVNDAPAGSDNTLAASEDTSITLQGADFGFSDSIDGNLFTAVTITTLPTNGTLSLASAPVTTAQTIGIADINNGDLVFTPLANANGAGLTDFNFQVHDNGGTADGGIDQDQSPNTITVDVTNVNDAPTGTDNTLTTNEDTSITLQGSDFGFSDSIDGNFFAAVTITTLPANGTLSLAGAAVTSGQTISISGINNGELVFTPTANGNGASIADFNFQVHDNGGIANGGIDQDQTPNTITFDVNKVNDAPTGSDNTLSTNEDTSITLQGTDFGFSDSIDGDFFAAVTVTTLPANGILTLAGVPVAAAQTINVSNINNGDLVFTPSPDDNGNNYTNFDFQVHDNGGVANGGIDQDQAPNKITFDVASVSDAPAGADKFITINEDTDYTLALADFGFTDPLDTIADQFQSIEITQLPITGTLTNNASAVGTSAIVTTDDIASGSLIYTPSANSFGQAFDNLLFRVIDSGITINGGENQDQTDNQIIFDITGVSDAPLGTDTSISINEDSAYTLQGSDFGYSDINDGDFFSALTVVDLPANGNLTLADNPVTDNQVISITDVNNGNLIFTPAQDSNGSDNAEFTFLVHDTGTIANGGLNISQSQNTAVFNVVSINDAPIGQDSSAQVADNTSYTLSATDFPFTDTENHALQSVRIDALPASGLLTLNGTAVLTDTIISNTDLAAGALVYQPALNIATQDMIGFSVIDNGDTTNGGNNTQAAPAQLTLTTLIVNDPPIASDNNLNTNEDNPIILNVADFGFTDPEEQHEFSELLITSVSGGGTLSLGGVPITSTVVVTVSDINASQLVLTPDSNAFGNTYATIEFQVKDDGGTANGGQDTSQTHTLTIDVASVNDAPSAISTSFNLAESSAHLFKLSDFGFSDNPDGHSLQQVIFTQLPSAGALTVNGAQVQINQPVNASEIANGNLNYQPAQGQSGQPFDSLQFKVQDNGGTLNGGQNTSLLAETITFNVTEVNTAPTGSDSNIAITEHETAILNRADFGFSDTDDNHNFKSVLVTSLSNNGLTYNGTPVSVGDEIQVGDIDADLLTYTASTNDVLNQIGFQVTDNGDPLNGATIDPSENLITFDLTLINDSPELTNEPAIYAEGSDNTISTTVLAAIDPDDPAQELLFTLQSIPGNGQLVVNDTVLGVGEFFTMQQLTNSEIHYIHDGSETSNDFFDFALTDGGEDGVVPITARFNIEITEVVDPMPALPDNSLSLANGESFDSALGDVLNSGETTLLDSSFLGTGFFVIEIVEQPDHGTVLLNPDGTFLYQHDGSSAATDFFVYRVTNDDGASAIARVNIIAEPKIDSAIAEPPVNEFPFITGPVNSTPPTTQQASPVVETELAVEQLVEEEPESIETDEAATETTTSSDSEAAAAEQQTSLSSEESFFAASAVSSTSSFANQPAIQGNVIYSEYDLEVGASLIERDLLRSIDVRQHNESVSIYVFEDHKTTTFSVSSVDIRLDTPTGYSEAVNNSDFLRGLSRAQQDLESADTFEKRRFEVGGEVAVSVSISTTAGILAWLLRGGALFGSMMAATPIWASIDPLRITDAKNKEEDAESSEVEDIFR